MLRLVRSSKFMTGVLGIAVAVLVHLGVEEAQAQQIVDAVLYIVVTLIGATALEDAAGKFKGE